jgi:chaperone required for assembly of F1-ATPase
MSFVEDAPRRFYKEATVKEENGAFAVLLEARPLRTPKKAPLALPTRALAEAIAAEWNAQEAAILFDTMPLTRLANVALDFTGATRAEVEASVVKYGETDLTCHRAGDPAPLVARENAAWDPLLAWAEGALGVRLAKIIGILPQTQPPAALAALETAAHALDDFRLTGLAHGAGLSSSAIIAFAIERGTVSAEDAFAAATLEEHYQLEVWGEDREARERLDRLKAEFQALETFFAALG